MEGQKNIRTTNRQIRLKLERETNGLRLVIIFHLVGILGLHFLPTKPYFMDLVPYHLLFMTGVVVYCHESVNRNFWYFFLTVFIIGFGVEWVGVHTGQPFGDYTYGPTLGPKISKIPFVMGATWFLLTYGTGVAMRLLRIRALFLRIVAGATLLTILDSLMEPVAIRLNYWRWADPEVPVNNYAAWFVISLVLLFVFEKFDFKKQSMVGPAVVASQFIFFAALQ